MPHNNFQGNSRLYARSKVVHFLSRLQTSWNVKGNCKTRIRDRKESLQRLEWTCGSRHFPDWEAFLPLAYMSISLAMLQRYHSVRGCMKSDISEQTDEELHAFRCRECSYQPLFLTVHSVFAISNYACEVNMRAFSRANAKSIWNGRK